MESTWRALLNSEGLRPATAGLAAVLAVLVGGMTLIASIIVIGPLTGPTDPLMIMVWLVVVVQVVAAVLLVAGGALLAAGAGRLGLVVGATLQLLVCGVYLLYAVLVVKQDSTEPPATVVVFTIIPLFFAALLASSLVLALRPVTAEYLTLMGQGDGR